jgi:hypothetical protein
MAVDTPAKISVLGAGPIGLEAALYGRFLGYDVAIYERGRVADNVLRWGHVRMFSPFYMNRSPLGLAALEAQAPSFRPPDDQALLTARQWADAYLIPLSQTDLLADHVHEHTSALAIGREGTLKGELVGSEERDERPFRILLRDPQGREWADMADVVIDTTGVYGNPNWMGDGGIPAIGESTLRDRIEYHLPDVLGTGRDRYAGRHTLLVGSGYSAATTLLALVQLAKDSPATRITWATRRTLAANDDGPICRFAGDPLAERDLLAQTANRLARAGDGCLRHLPATSVKAVGFDVAENQFNVQLVGQHAGSHHFDRIIANVGYRPDKGIYEELHVHQCYASDGPMKLAAALLGEASADCLDQTSHGPQSLLNPEPNFYILGAKSYGRNSNFLVSIGLAQIRELFSLIGDRENLDLYSSIKNLLR